MEDVIVTYGSEAMFWRLFGMASKETAYRVVRDPSNTVETGKVYWAINKSKLRANFKTMYFGGSRLPPGFTIEKVK